MFTIRGRLDGRPASATWDAGQLVDGDPELVARAELAARLGSSFAPAGLPSAVASLADERSALLTLAHVLDHGGPPPDVDGARLPDPDPLPDGAIA